MNTNIEEYIEPMKSRFTDKMGDIQYRVTDTAKSVSRATDRYVRDNPWKTVAVVALAACMFGWLLNSARD